MSRSVRPTAIALAAALCVFAADVDAPLPFPADYREWVFLSSGLGMTYGPLAAKPDESPRFENVFVLPAAYRSFLKSGQWPDGTTFVLEIRASESKGSINKGGRFQAAIAGIEAESKSGGRWTFYSFEPDARDRKADAGKPFPRTATCYACHAANGAVDNTFVQFYPTLAPVARAHGTYRESERP